MTGKEYLESTKAKLTMELSILGTINEERADELEEEFDEKMKLADETYSKISKYCLANSAKDQEIATISNNLLEISDGLFKKFSIEEVVCSKNVVLFHEILFSAMLLDYEAASAVLSFLDTDILKLHYLHAVIQKATVDSNKLLNFLQKYYNIILSDEKFLYSSNELKDLIGSLTALEGYVPEIVDAALETYEYFKADDEQTENSVIEDSVKEVINEALKQVEEETEEEKTNEVSNDLKEAKDSQE